MCVNKIILLISSFLIVSIISIVWLRYYQKLIYTSPSPTTSNSQNTEGILRLNQNLDIINPSESLPKISLLFGGDLMFDRDIRKKSLNTGNYDFMFGPKLQSLFYKQDLIIANFEGPITSFPSRSMGSAIGSTNNYFFTFDPLVLETISKWPWLVNLGNNHIWNFGEEGFVQTVSYLDSTNIPHFGYVKSDDLVKRSYVFMKDSISVGFVNYNQFVWGGESAAFNDIDELKNKVDFLVLYAHWGNEYVQENMVIRDLAHQFIDAGADLIIGSHPHVVQGIEEYKSKMIYYSLGNFVFDQYFEPAVMKGLLVEMNIKKSMTNEIDVKFLEYPITLSFSGETELVASPSAFQD